MTKGLVLDSHLKTKLVTWDGNDNEQQKYVICLGKVFADTPARCFLLGTKYHTGFCGCGRCTTHGIFKKNRTCFPELESTRRTDESFALKTQIEHHNKDNKWVSDLNLKVISQVPLDVMHLVYLGVTKKIIGCLLKGDLRVKLNSQLVNTINENLLRAKDSQPSEFSRRIRVLTDVGLFKATEFRVFLLYTGIVVLRDVIRSDIYDNFMLLSCGIRILSDENEYLRNNECAMKLLYNFVITFGHIYGQHLISYNVHNIVHLADEVICQNEPLDKFATWEFETSNSKLKSFSRKPSLFLAQAYNRTIEKYNADRQPEHKKKEKENKINVVYICGFRLDSSVHNKWFVSENQDIWEFGEAFDSKNDGNIDMIRGRKILKKQSFFTTPIDSACLGIYKSDGKLSVDKSISMEKIKNKLFHIEKINHKNVDNIFVTMI